MDVHERHGVAIATLCQALSISRATLYRRQQVESEVNTTPKIAASANALANKQQESILGLLHSERFIDRTPYDVFYTLLDEGKYCCSIRTMYRLLQQNGENQDRRNQRSHRDAIKPELIATAPNQVWSWDITKLLTTRKLRYYHLYVIMDIFSRYVVGWLIAEAEAKELARKLIKETTLKQGIQPGTLCLHADNGPSMRSGTVSELLIHLGVDKSHSRPYTSNDNPFSESQFKTLKYRPEFPGRFESIEQAEKFCQSFFNWYNRQHYHSGIAWLTPETVHCKKSESILEKRHQSLMQAYEGNPVRFNRKAPKKVELAPAVYINPPENNLIQTSQKEENVA